MAIAFALLPLSAADGRLAAATAAASSINYRFDIPAGPASAALSAFAMVTGIGIGWPDALASIRLRPVRGRMSADKALRRLFAGSGYRALQVGPTAYRIVVAPPPVEAARRPLLARRPPSRQSPATLPADILVTGQKQSQRLDQIAASIAVIDPEGASNGRLSPGSRDVAASIEGLALTNLGPGRNRQFIRGIADSPFNGPSQSTVAIQLDEARVTFDAPDPDLRLVDVERIELLKGPQGPLYGSGALGGIYHVVTRKPDATVASGAIRSGGEAVGGGGIGGAVEAVVNVPIAFDRLAVRAVGYIAREAGWIDDIGADRNVNSALVRGARLALRWRADADWTVDVSGILQDVNTRDSQYVTSSDKTVRRDAMIREPTDNDFRSAAATIEGRIGGVHLLGTTSFVDHQVDTVLDSTAASAAFGLSGQSSFHDGHRYKIVNHELRLSPSGSARWLAGLSYLHARSDMVGTIGNAATSLTAESLDRRVSEIAIFGQALLPIFDRIDVSVGARLFRTIAEDEALERAGGDLDRTRRTIVSPSASLSWRPRPNSIVYLRYARALRPGGLSVANDASSRRFDSDELGTAEIGVRLSASGDHLALSASLFDTRWSHIQSDYLLSNGLIATRNAGRGRILGAEADAEWRLNDGLQMSIGASYVDARLVRTEDGFELENRRLPITPDLTARAVIQYRRELGTWSAVLSAQTNYVGRARLTFDPALDRAMGGYATVSSGLSASRGPLTIKAGVDNLLNVTGDSFAFGNPFSIALSRQYTPLKPRTFTLSLRRSW